MPEFDFLLKQINEKIDKTSNKMQQYALKVIPLEEERDRLEVARNGLEGNIKEEDKSKRPYTKTDSSLRNIIFDVIRDNEGQLNSKDIRKKISQEFDYIGTYVTTKLSNLYTEGFLKKDKQGRFSMRSVGPATKVKGEITADPNENTLDSFPAL